MAEGARLESVYTRKCIEGSNPSLTAKFKEKAWIRVQAFFAWCTDERGEKPRQGSTKRLRFGPPTAARRVSAANQALSHRQIQKESLDSRPGFFCMVHRREGREASTGFDKTPAFWTANGGPQGERSESSPLSPPNSKRKPGFASRLFLHGAPPRGARSLDRVRQNACVLDRQRRPAG